MGGSSGGTKYVIRHLNMQHSYKAKMQESIFFLLKKGWISINRKPFSLTILGVIYVRIM